jgi:hypothetical protein
MTAQTEIRLSVEDLEIVSGGRLGDQYKAYHKWVHPMDIVTKVPALEVEIVAIAR